MTDAEDVIDMMVADTIGLVVRLADYYETADEIAAWLQSPQALLDNRLPRDIIASGDVTKIHRLFDNMDAGAFI